MQILKILYIIFLISEKTLHIKILKLTNINFINTT